MDFGLQRSRDTSLVLIHIMDAQQFAFKIPDPFRLKFDLLVGNSEQVRVKVNEDFAYHILEMYKKRIRRATQTQSFPVQYAPLSPKYVERKRKKGWYTGFWRATGALIRNMRTWEEYGEYFIGFRPFQIHPTHKKPYVEIFRYVEFGNPPMGVPARPLFVPIAHQINKELPILFEKFLLKNFRQYQEYFLTEGDFQEQQETGISKQKSDAF